MTEFIKIDTNVWENGIINLIDSDTCVQQRKK